MHPRTCDTLAGRVEVSKQAPEPAAPSIPIAYTPRGGTFLRMHNDTTIPAGTAIGQNLAFLAFPASQAAEQAPKTIIEIATRISTLVHSQLVQAISARTSLEFRETRERNISRYMQAMIALSDLVTISLDNCTIELLTNAALTQLDAAFSNAEQAFGREVVEQAVFTVWTLRKISQLVQQCNGSKVSQEFKNTDVEFARQYVGHVLFARFHLDCLSLALIESRTIFPEALSEISEGLRSAVDAYAWVRHGLELRSTSADDLAVELPWDEEQEQLMHESTAGLARERY